MKSDPDHEWSTLLKVKLKPYDTLHGFTFVEANVKDTFDGETLIFCPMSEKKIWGEEDNDEARVYEGLVKFFKRSDYICNEDINLYTKIISDELAKIIDTLNKVSTENSEFIKKKFYLSELSAVLMLNHDKKKGCIKQVAPKFSANKGKYKEIVDSLENLKYHVDNLQKNIDKKGTSFYAKGGCCIF